jgi:uncharacterized protein YggU (UPF0235/DUF167 family)
MTGHARITIRVHPGASRAHVGWLPAGPGQEQILGVWVQQRAVDGKATEAALSAVADALGLRRRSLRLVTGERSRIKVVEISDPPADLTQRRANLTGP